MFARFSIACLVCFAVAGTVKAENAYGESIEWIVADSDRVVVGKITKVEQSGENEIVTIDVSKTIRGKHEEKIQCTLRSSKSGGAWQKAGVPMLFCLKDTKEFPKTSLVLRFGPQYSSAFFLGKTDLDPTHVFTRDFAVLTDSAAVVKHVEAYAKTIPADWKRKSVKLDATLTPVCEKLYAGSAVYFTLPADAALEAQGKKWCKSDRPDNRVRGIISLKEFPSEENVKVLKGLLTDENVSTGSGKKYYYIRRQAFEALRDLGVKVDRPVLEEPAK